MEIKGLKSVIAVICISVSLFLVSCEDGELWYLCSHLSHAENELHAPDWNEIMEKAPEIVHFRADNSGVITLFDKTQKKFSYRAINDKGDYELNIEGRIEKITIKEISESITRVEYHKFKSLFYTLAPCEEGHK